MLFLALAKKIRGMTACHKKCSKTNNIAMPQCSNAGAATNAALQRRRATPTDGKAQTPPMEKVTDGKGQGGAGLRRGVVFAPSSTTPPMEKVTAAGASPPMEKVTPPMEKFTAALP